MLEQMLRICNDKGLQKPSCYQGDYNLITRGMETKLLPMLRAHGIVYNAFRYVAFRPPALAKQSLEAKSPI